MKIGSVVENVSFGVRPAVLDVSGKIHISELPRLVAAALAVELAEQLAVAPAEVKVRQLVK